MAPVFLMSPPAADWAPRHQANFISEKSSELDPVARGAALKDWLTLALAIDAAGGQILLLRPSANPPLTGLPFTAEAGCLVHQNGKPLFLLPNVTPAHRKTEKKITRALCAELGWAVAEISSPWEGQGDVIFVSPTRTLHTYGEGRWSRTTKTAFTEVRSYFSGESLSLSLGFRADPWFHGNTVLCVYYESTQTRPHLMVCREALLPGEWERLLEFLQDTPVFEISAAESLSFATNALQVNQTVLAPTGVPGRLHAFWKSLGLQVRELPLGILFRRGGGAAVCLTNRLWGVDPATLPESLTFTSLKRTLSRRA